MAKIGQVLNGESGFDARQKINEAIQDVEVSTGIKGDGIATPLTSDIAAEINAATEKTTPVDGDKVPAIDSEAGNVLKWYSWANIKATLKTYFDAFYSTTDENVKASGADTTPGSLSDKLTAGENITFTTLNAGGNEQIEIASSGGGGGGGHEYKENNVAIEQRAGRNILTNGTKVVLIDDGGEDETEENWFFEVGLDVDPTGKNDGDVWQYNAASEKTQPGATKPFDLVLNSVEAVSVNGQLSTIIPAGYALSDLIIENNGDDPQLIDIGFPTAGDQNIVASQSIVAGFNQLPLALTANTLGLFFSGVNDTDIFIDSDGTTLGLTLYFRFKKLI